MTIPQKRSSSRADTPGPPAGSMTAVNMNRDGTTRPASRRRRDDGRFKRPDCPSLKTGRGGLRLGSWNVRTLNQLGKLEKLLKEAKSLDIDVLGMAEIRYTGEGVVRQDGYTYIYSGGEEHQHGVGFLIKSSVEKVCLATGPTATEIS